VRERNRCKTRREIVSCVIGREMGSDRQTKRARERERATETARERESESVTD